MKNISLPKIINCGYFDSRLVYKTAVDTKPRKTVFFEIEIPLENSGTTFVDDEMKKAQTDTLIMVKPGQIRHTKLHFSCLYLYLSAEDGYICDILMNLPTFIKVRKENYYKEIFNDIANLLNSKNKNDFLIMQSKLLGLIYMLSNDAENDKKAVKRNKNTLSQTIDFALTYIEKNLSKNLTLNFVADIVSLSPIYFHKSFKKATGKTFQKYIEEKRIEKSVSLLTTTNMSITEIAYECGFCSQSYFSFVFKKHTGLSPREYIKDTFSKYNL